MALVINDSGGKDSGVMREYLRRRYPGVKIYVVYADTGFEHVKPFTAWEWVQARKDGLDCYQVRNPNKTYLEMVERRGKFPSSGQRQCTSDLKRDPIAKFIRNVVKEPIVINCMGIRAEESPARAKKRPLRRDKRLSTAGRTVWNWYPIFYWKLVEVLEKSKEWNVALHPVYVWAGGYLSRLSCRVCIFMTDSDVRAVYQNDREAFDQVSALEEKTGFTMKNGKSLKEIVGAGWRL